MVKLIDFNEAIQASDNKMPRHLLLGNGFSISCKPEIFEYNSLYETANFNKDEQIEKLFNQLKTEDFEIAIRVLEDGCTACTVYDPKNTQLAIDLKRDAKRLKDVLLRTITDRHPALPSEIEEEQYSACKSFLSHFISPSDQTGMVYTLNYDLLLYWAMMNDSRSEGEEIKLVTHDGFGRRKETPSGFVQWINDPSADQRVHYLHGAVHLLDDGTEVYKYTWSGTGTPLLKQIKSAMKKGKLPLFVAEGTGEQKLAKIRHSAYLTNSLQSFEHQMNQKHHSLFVYGCSFGENDRHIADCIARGRISNIYVALYKNVNSKSSRKIIEEVQRIAGERDSKQKLNVRYFDAASARVWGGP